MKFKVLKTSKIGNNITNILKKADECREAQIKLSKELGFKSWRGGYWSAWGGISCVFFDNTPDTKLWKKQDDGWFPKLNSKAGKELGKKFDELPRVSRRELNDTIDFKEPGFEKIGLNWSNDNYYGVMAQDDWGIVSNDELIEITNTEFNLLFKSKDNE